MMRGLDGRDEGIKSVRRGRYLINDDRSLHQVRRSDYASKENAVILGWARSVT